MPSVTDKFLFTQILLLDPCKTKTILDYGCGRGVFVRMLHENGFNAYGADIEGFWEDYFEHYTDRDLFLKKKIRLIQPDGAMDFEDHSFDIIVCDHVVEHTDEKDRLFQSIRRLLKIDGTAYILFPVREGLRESHIKQFFIHWLPKGRLRYCIALLQRKIGIADKKDSHLTVHQYLHEKLNGIDTNTYYESFPTIRKRMEKFFVVEPFEINYLSQRLPDMGMRFLVPLVKMRLLKAILEIFFRLYSFAVVKVTSRPERF
jgi:SAM-dependent methyltransferase